MHLHSTQESICVLTLIKGFKLQSKLLYSPLQHILNKIDNTKKVFYWP